MYDTWCLSVTPDILNIPDIPEIPYIPDIPAILKVPDIPDIPFYYHAKSGCPSSKIGKVLAILSSMQICSEVVVIVEEGGKTLFNYLDIL